MKAILFCLFLILAVLVGLSLFRGHIHGLILARSDHRAIYNHSEPRYSYTVQSNGKWTFTNGTMAGLQPGQWIHMTIKESDQTYRYRISAESTGLTVKGSGTPLTEADQTRINKTLATVAQKSRKPE